MALDQSALLEVLEALKAAEVAPDVIFAPRGKTHHEPEPAVLCTTRGFLSMN